MREVVVAQSIWDVVRLDWVGTMHTAVVIACVISGAVFNFA